MLVCFCLALLWCTPSDIQLIAWDFYLAPCYWWPLSYDCCSWAPWDYIVFNFSLSTYCFMPITAYLVSGIFMPLLIIVAAIISLQAAMLNWQMPWGKKAVPSVRITSIFPFSKDFDTSVLIALVAVRYHRYFIQNFYCFHWENCSILSWSAKDGKTVYHILV